MSSTCLSPARVPNLERKKIDHSVNYCLTIVCFYVWCHRIISIILHVLKYIMGKVLASDHCLNVSTTTLVHVTMSTNQY